MESVDRSLVEMDEMWWRYLEKVIDALDERMESMGKVQDEKTVQIWFDVEVLLVSEHREFDKI